MAGDGDDQDRDEGTKRSVKMPTLPTAPPPGQAAPSPPDEPEATSTRTEVRHPLDAGASEGGTIRRPDRAVPAVRLQRLQPPGRSGVVELNRPQFLLGRLQTSDIRLFTATASREHARITMRGDKWYLQPLGSAVTVNGVALKEEIALSHKMHLKLGEDELVFIDDAVAAGEGAGQVEHAASGGPSRTGLIVVIAVLAAVAVGVLVWLVASG